jgi:hypothetical protein
MTAESPSSIEVAVVLQLARDGVKSSVSAEEVTASPAMFEDLGNGTVLLLAEWASKQNPIESLFASKVKMLRVLMEKKWNAAKALELVNDIERLLTDTTASPLALLIEVGSAELRKRLMPTQDSGKTLLKILANTSEDSGKTQQMLQDTVVEEVDGQATDNDGSDKANARSAVQVD